MPESRAEHLAWSKQRALEYVDRGELENAIASMGSDLKKHEAWRDSRSVSFMVTEAIMFELARGPEAVRRWIEGFN